MRTIVAASDGLVYCDDGSVWSRCVPSGSRGEWLERQPIPGTARQRAYAEQERLAAWAPRDRDEHGNLDVYEQGRV